MGYTHAGRAPVPARTHLPGPRRRSTRLCRPRRAQSCVGAAGWRSHGTTADGEDGAEGTQLPAEGCRPGHSSSSSEEYGITTTQHAMLHASYVKITSVAMNCMIQQHHAQASCGGVHVPRKRTPSPDTVLLLRVHQVVREPSLGLHVRAKATGEGWLGSGAMIIQRHWHRHGWC